MQVMTNSRRAVYRRCQREHFFAYELGAKPRRTAAALSFGTIFHAGLEAWWGWWRDADDVARDGEGAGVDPSLALPAALEAARTAFQDQVAESELLPYDLIKAEEMLRAYHFRWMSAMRDYRVLHVEVEFSMPLVNPDSGHGSRTWVHAGKLDAIVIELSTNRVWIVEHKTTTSVLDPASDYWKRLRIDGQVSTYFDGARALGHDVFGCIYDVARKPTHERLLATPEEARKYTKPTKAEPIPRLYANQREHDESDDDYRARVREAIAEDPNRYLGRGEVVRLDDDLTEHRRDVWMTSGSMRESQRTRCHPRNPDACVRYGRFCDFFDVCTGVADINDPTLFELGRANRELSVGSNERSREG